MSEPLNNSVQKIVVIMPSWLGDAVMATPFLRALRGRFPHAHIVALALPLAMPVLAGLGHLVDEVREYRKAETAATTRWLKEGRFDLGILLPNSFRSAWMLWRGGVKRRVGYAREWRSWLLTDRLRPEMRTPAQAAIDAQKVAAIRMLGGAVKDVGSAYQPVPTIDYYLRLAEHLGAPTDEQHLPTEREMELGITAGEIQLADQALVEQGTDVAQDLVVMVPGANFGSSKCWSAERFAMVADLLMDRKGDFNATVVLASSPAELPLVEAIIAASNLKISGRLIALGKLNGGKGLPLGALKQIIRRSRLIVCNDTGPRHFAAALGVPVVTLFGPTDPVWAETFSKNERQVRIDVPCGPCQLKQCPIDHRCMRGIEVEMVMNAVRELWHASKERVNTVGG